MTDKKENILRTALELFAQDGYKATSTSRIAKAAGVSEGLIFRHFGNKEGLLEAILSEGERQVKLLFADLVLEENPVEVIRKVLNLGTEINKKPEDAHFWKLQYKIKWETERYGAHKIQPLLTALSKAFSKLDYPNPELEAQRLVHTLDGMAMQFYLTEGFDMDHHLSFLRTIYKV